MSASDDSAMPSKASPTNYLFPTSEDFKQLERDLDRLQTTMMRDEDGKFKRYDDDDDEEIENLIKQRLPLPEHRQKYRQWIQEEFEDREKEHRNAKLEFTADEFFDVVKSTRFTNANSFHRLLTTLDSDVYPYIGIGTHMGFHYRLRTTSYVLIADERLTWWEDPREPTDVQIVGINVTDSPGIRSNKGITDRFEVHKTTEWKADGSDSIVSDDRDVLMNDTSGFVFMQLGEVMSVPVQTWAEGRAADPPTHPMRMKWQNTYFCLGVVVDHSNGGTAGEVWLLYDWLQQDEMNGIISEIPEDDPYWGYLEMYEGDRTRRSGFKIADKITDLGDGKGWNIDKFFKYKYDCVPAMVHHDEQKGKLIVRQQGLSSKRPASDLEGGCFQQSQDLSSEDEALSRKFEHLSGKYEDISSRMGDMAIEFDGLRF